MVTVRTIKLKRSSQAYGDSGGSGNLSAPMVPETAPPQQNATPASPADPSPPVGSTAPAAPVAAVAAAPKTVPGKSTVWFMLIALFAALGLLIILGLQYSEMSFYKADPSVWLH